VLLGVIQYETHPAFIWILGAGTCTVVILHLVAGIQEVQKDRVEYPTIALGFVKVCRVESILTDQAKVFNLGGERIAIFRSAKRLYAISNVCKHQNGPLGEGKIVDGCVTCPWHGYQYLPHNGQSPPPFKEKVSTYDVQIVHGQVWVHPMPYPEGTERPGAIIA
jgi:methionine sulfoxide reductase heme-binding subunit